MNIGHLQKFSLIDYPGHICAVIFTTGCNFYCPWCHNPELVKGFPTDKLIDPADVLSFLKKRQGKLEGVAITGGEPTLQGDKLLEFVESVKSLGFPVKVDTNGSLPDVLEQLIRGSLVDFLAMDVKGPRETYSVLTGVPVDTRTIDRSIRMIMDSSIEYEFRTTIVRSLLTTDDMVLTASRIAGAERYVLQRFNPGTTLNPDFKGEETGDIQELAHILEQVRRWVPSAILR